MFPRIVFFALFAKFVVLEKKAPYGNFNSKCLNRCFSNYYQVRTRPAFAEWRGGTYLLVVDYFSKYIEISKLENETSHEVVLRLKSVFARHGMFSDNGPQYSSMEFSDFAKDYKFVHTTSSPKFPQSNGEAERAVCIIKTLLQKADDPYAALLAYRSTPVCCGYSPAELLMNRQLHSTVPIAPTQLQPVIPDYSKLKEREETMREKQTENFNSHHQSRELTPLFPGETVWVTDQQTPCLMLHAPEVEGFLLTCRGL